MHDLPWDDLRLFLAVAESRSMSAAARQLRLGQPTISRRLAALEATLGEPLFRRSVAGVSLTASGERLLAPARKMAEWAGEAQRAAGARQQKPEGVVRIASPPLVAWDLLAPFALQLKRKLPGLRLELLSGIGYLDLARGEADLALRARPATQPELTNVVELRLGVRAVAHRDYVARLPKRYGFADVDWICWAPPYDTLPPNPQLQAWIPQFRPVLTSDNPLVQRRAAEAGLGATVWAMTRPRARSGASALVPLELDLGPHATTSHYLVCAKSALEIARVRLVAELLVEELRRVLPA